MRYSPLVRLVRYCYSPGYYRLLGMGSGNAPYGPDLERSAIAGSLLVYYHFEQTHSGIHDGPPGLDCIYAAVVAQRSIPSLEPVRPSVDVGCGSLLGGTAARHVLELDSYLALKNT